MLIILQGAPPSGKTTLSKKIDELCGSTFITINPLPSTQSELDYFKGKNILVDNFEGDKTDIEVIHRLAEYNNVIVTTMYPWPIKTDMVWRLELLREIL